MIPTQIYGLSEGRRALDGATAAFEAVSRLLAERE